MTTFLEQNNPFEKFEKQRIWREFFLTHTLTDCIEKNIQISSITLRVKAKLFDHENIEKAYRRLYESIKSWGENEGTLIEKEINRERKWRKRDDVKYTEYYYFSNFVFIAENCEYRWSSLSFRSISDDKLKNLKNSTNFNVAKCPNLLQTVYGLMRKYPEFELDINASF